VPTYNKSHLLRDVTNTSVTLLGHHDRMTFIGSTSSGVVAQGSNQTVSLINDSWMVVQSNTQSSLHVLIRGIDSNITLVDLNQNMKIDLVHQGAYTISNDTTGPIPGAFINTAHSSIFVMYANAAALEHDVRAMC
jgi:hypothetical protein